jgi:hypothetical protein
MLEGLTFLVVSFTIVFAVVVIRDNRRRRRERRRPGYIDLRQRHR